MMTAVRVRALKELRARWRAWLAIALMVGIAGGVVMAAAAGARRSETAVPRFMTYAQATNAFAGADPALYPAIAKLPQVEAAVEITRLAMADAISTAKGVALGTIALVDPSLPFPRVVLTAGRMFDPGKVDEAVVNEQTVRDGLLDVGDRITLKGFTQQQANAVLAGTDLPPNGPSVTVRVVGVMKIATDLTTSSPPKGVVYTGNDNIFLTPALFKEFRARIAQFGGPGLAVRLRRGEKDLDAFTKAVMDLAHGQAFVGGGSDDVQAAAEAQRATHTEAIALWLFTALAGGAALLVIGQSASRQIFVEAGDNGTLLALGMSRAQIAGVALVQVVAASAAGAVIAVATAILLSPLSPLGLAREADVDIGFHFDAPVILLGAAGCIVLLGLRGLIPAWLSSKESTDTLRHRPIRPADALARAGLPASSVAGVRMALDPGHGRNAVPVRTAVAGSVLATAVLITAVAFGASLSHLAGQPRLQGWTWDVAVGNPHAQDDVKRAIPLLQKNPLVGGFSADAYGAVELDHHVKLETLGIDKVAGDVGPPVLEGRSPSGPDEIAIGTKTLRTLSKRVGDRVAVTGQDGKARAMRIVGRAVVTPNIVNGQISMGEGAMMSLTDLRRFVPPAPEDEGAVNVFLVKFSPGADRSAAMASLQRDFPHTVLTPYAPAEVENLRRIDSLPRVLAGLLGLLAIATIAHALITSVRRRRHDLAILKTLGFVRSQVRATVAWQASTLSVIASVIGLVGGAIAGRWLWIVYADRLGVRGEPSLPMLLLAIVVPGTLLIANIVASLPARSAARTQPALVLRTE